MNLSVTLHIIKHKNDNQIAISFEYNFTLKEIVKQIPNVRWSATHKTFYLLFSLDNLHYIKTYLLSKTVFVIDKTGHFHYPVLPYNDTISLIKFKKWLAAKRLSENTINVYAEVTTFFLRYLRLKKITIVDNKSIEAFNYDFIVSKNKSVSYQNQCINGIKKYLLYQGVVVEDLEIERPKKDRILPAILSEAEVKLLLSQVKNLKHYTLLALIYSAGLRIGEALHLQPKDIDSKRMLVHVRNAKGRKDRYTLLSSLVLKHLREYYIKYKPKAYLFEGRKGGKYTQSSARKVLRRAVIASGLKKRITLHTLRHSFATHLLENGTDIRYIQELLGHGSPKTTMIYTHVSSTKIASIKNPFDSF